MATDDPIRDLTHDHGDLNRRVLELGALVGGRGGNGIGGGGERALAALRELREDLFLHFAKEEEGLFPFVAERLPELAEQVHAMASAHDAICGALARMVHLATAGGEPTLLGAMFERFEASYAAHARAEAELLGELERRLDAAARAQLAALVAGL